MITVTHEGVDRLRIAVRGHEVYTDQPVADGGEDSAPTPTELFVASLGACIAFYAERYLRRHGVPAYGLEVRCEYGWAEHPHRVGDIDISVDAPGLPPERHEAFQRVIEHCTIHNPLLQPPAVRIVVGSSQTAPV